MSHLVAVAPALPQQVHAQGDITAVIGPLLLGTAPSTAGGATLARLHAASGVRTRHLALPLEAYASLRSFGTANDHFIRIGLDLAEEASRAALDRAGLDASEIDFLMFTSVTGISAPSLDALLVPRLGLRSDVRRLPSFGLGCAGGAAGVARVHDYLEGHRDHVALLVAVELCSLTIQHGDDSMANLVSSGLFGDGAAAVVMVGDDHRLARPPAPAAGPGRSTASVVATRSRLYPDTEGHLGWQVGASGFRIVLASGLPDIIAANLCDDVTGFLEVHDLKVRDVTTWVVHAGGPKILAAVQSALDLDASSLDVSRESLASVGNLSSASVLHVLAATVATEPAPGSPGLMIAFGPGVSAELVLLRWGVPG